MLKGIVQYLKGGKKPPPSAPLQRGEGVVCLMSFVVVTPVRDKDLLRKVVLPKYGVID